MPVRIINKRDADLIRHIAKRTTELTQSTFRPCGAQDLAFSLRLCHRTRPLDLEALLAAEDDAFARDVFGIHLNLRLRPGRILNNNFVSRFFRHTASTTTSWRTP